MLIFLFQAIELLRWVYHNDIVSVTSDPTSCPLAGTKLYCLVTEAHVCEQHIQSCVTSDPTITFPASLWPVSNCTAWWQRQMHMNSIPKVITVHESGTAWSWKLCYEPASHPAQYDVSEPQLWTGVDVDVLTCLILAAYRTPCTERVLLATNIQEELERTSEIRRFESEMPITQTSSTLKSIYLETRHRTAHLTALTQPPILWETVKEFQAE